MPSNAALLELVGRSVESASLDEALFGDADPRVVAAWFERAAAQLGAPIARAHFCRAGTGRVLGATLADGRRVVLKALRRGARLSRLAACARVRSALASQGFPCSAPLCTPLELGPALLVAEALDERGAPADGHDPPVRREMAATLAHLVALTRGRPELADGLGPAWFSAIPRERALPASHSPRYDFEATAAGATWMEEIAREARVTQSDEDDTPNVVGHFDWRAEHLRFEAGRVVTSFDWDSLHLERESVMAGAAAHAFTADASRPERAQAPSVDEMLLFLAAYEEARGTPFSAKQRRTARRSCLFSLAYSARLCHAESPDREGGPGDFRPTLRAAAAVLLASS